MVNDFTQQLPIFNTPSLKSIDLSKPDLEVLLSNYKIKPI